MLNERLTPKIVLILVEYYCSLPLTTLSMYHNVQYKSPTGSKIIMVESTALVPPIPEPSL